MNYVLTFLANLYPVNMYYFPLQLLHERLSSGMRLMIETGLSPSLSRA